MPSKVLIHDREHRPVGDPGKWHHDVPKNQWVGHAHDFKDCAQMLKLPYTEEVAA